MKFLFNSFAPAGRATRLVRRVTRAALLFALAACGDPVSACADICWTTAIVYGTVQTAAGVPISGVVVSVSAFKDLCEETQRRTFRSEARTNAQGRFQTKVSSQFAPFTSKCITVGPDSVLAPAWPQVTEAFPVSLEMRLEDERRDTPRDSVGVILVLPTTAAAVTQRES